ncbi:hypothetical protein BUE80_DR004011 [Diplocarpon rosae]|nr:hypothetical protein BUE80_DR004011 [Diplocarpon rosae]
MAADKNAQKALPPTRGKGVTKKKKSALPPLKHTQKRRACSPSPKDIPIWDQGVTTKAARERKRFKISRASLHGDFDEDYIVQQASLLQGEDKISWGVQQRDPVEASRRPKQKGRRVGRVGGMFEAQLAYMAMFENMQPQRDQPRPNSPLHSPILRIPLEVREEVYSYLLVSPSPIYLKADWTTLERNQCFDHSLVRVCKQFANETSSFLYRNNTFQSLIREPPAGLLRHEKPVKIRSEFHSSFRHIAIDCSRACWNMEWHEKATEGLISFVKARATINTITLKVVPQRVGMSTTALGDEASPLTFADFLWYPGPFMQAVRKLAPKRFKVVVTESGKSTLGMELDLTYLRVGTIADNLLTNEETLKLRDARLGVLKQELMALKGRFEKMFEADSKDTFHGSRKAMK